LPDCEFRYQDGCTRCGKCVEVCPITAPAGVADATPLAVISGVFDILRSGEGPQAATAWATGCALTGDCIAVCDVGVNPRFLLAMARVALARQSSELRERRKRGIDNFRLVADGVNVLARMQLGDDDLVRLGQQVTDRLENASTAKPGERPDFVFYTGCNVLKTPHMALLALDIMDALGVTYRVMGGPSHCCGVIQLRTGDTEVSGRVASSSLDKLAEGKTGVISWCASCHVQFTETTLPAIEKVRGSRPFEMTPPCSVSTRFDDLRPMLKKVDADCAAQASGREGRGGGRHVAAAHGARHRDRRPASAGGRIDEQCAQCAAGLQARAAAGRAGSSRCCRCRRAGCDLSCRSSRIVRA
jgi:Fe-S oxidoreductase